MQLRLLHRTIFIYDGHARDSFNETRLRPGNDANQACRRFSLRTDPTASVREYHDFYGNAVQYFDINDSHEKLIIEAKSEVVTTPLDKRPPLADPPMSAVKADPDRDFYAEFLSPSHYVPEDSSVWREARDVLASGETTVFADAVRLGHHVFKSFTYKQKVTGVNTLAPDALKLRAGVCQDFAHVTLGLCRSAGIPARYVSGYFLNESLKPGESEASHAWIEVHVPGYGWAGFDPTHDRIPDERYIKVASGRDYADIRPIKGGYVGASTRSMTVEVSVTAKKN